MMLRYNYRFCFFLFRVLKVMRTLSQTTLVVHYTMLCLLPTQELGLRLLGSFPVFNSSLNDLEGLYKVEIVKLVWFRPY